MMDNQKVIRCDRCNRIITDFWSVLGFEGTYGKHCADEICKGNKERLKKVVISIDPEDLPFEIPF
jgi:hypothetical protein